MNESIVVKGTRKLGALLGVDKRSILRNIKNCTLDRYLSNKGYVLQDIKKVDNSYIFVIEPISVHVDYSTEVSPDSIEVSSDSIEVTPDSIEVSSDSIEVTPDSTEVTPDSTEVTPKLYYNESGKLIAPPPDAPAGSLKLYLFTKYLDDKSEIKNPETTREEFNTLIGGIVKEVQETREEEREYYKSVNKYF